MKNLYQEISKCRICGSKNLESVMNVGILNLSGFLTEKNLDKNFKAPLELVLCKGACNLLQLKHSVNSEEMFREYWYLSGINNSMKNELSNITETVTNLSILQDKDIVLDIGSNDSTLLKSYKNKDLITVGFEPALNLKKINTKNVSRIINDYFNFESWDQYYPKSKAKVITAIGMFYDLEDPEKFTKDVEKTLDKNGIFIIQMMYLPFFIQRNAFDGICHEHLEYYSLKTLEFLLDKCNLKVIGLEVREKVNEGSIRFYISKKNCTQSFKLDKQVKDNVKYFRNLEDTLKLDHVDTYKKFKKRIDLNKEKIILLLNEIKDKKQIVHGYAASTKGNTTLQYYKLNTKNIEAIADKNPDKFGKFTSGSNIPIISEKDSRKKQPNYYFVLAWHFIDEFILREIEFLKKGGKFIIPMPELQIIDIENYKDFLKKNKDSDFKKLFK